MEEQAKKIAQLLKLLANEYRLLILCALMQGPKTVGEIHTFTPSITPSALSQHLSLLKSSGILDFEKIGMHVIYRIQDSKIALLIEVLKEQYCPQEGAYQNENRSKPE